MRWNIMEKLDRWFLGLMFIKGMMNFRVFCCRSFTSQTGRIYHNAMDYLHRRRYHSYPRYHNNCSVLLPEATLCCRRRQRHSIRRPDCNDVSNGRWSIPRGTVPIWRLARPTLFQWRNAQRTARCVRRCSWACSSTPGGPGQWVSKHDQWQKGRSATPTVRPGWERPGCDRR